MAEQDTTLTLGPAQHEKLGSLYCGVTREGFIAVAGEPRNIEDGEEITINRVPVKVKRNGSEYTFQRVA